jgi:EAL domain-containing protein (putative c-di-GMP-specific phosphodiesterase class I)
MQNKRGQDSGLPPCVVSVNVSPRQFRSATFMATLSAVLHETGLDPSYLELELTESMVMHDGEEMIEALRAIKNLGVHMSVDDFGTGYSSLSYLKRFPVDRLKIDRSFVSDMTTDGDSAAIVRTIIALGHNLGLKVLAEGVETDDQVDFLLANGCDELQGYWFSRPVSSWRLRGLLTK